MGKITAILELFYQGKQVADPQKWKRGTINVNALVVFLGALVEVLRAFDVPIAVSTEQLAAIAGGVLALFNVVAVVAGSSRLGLPGATETNVPPDAGADAQQAQGGVADAPRPVGESITDPGSG